MNNGVQDQVKRGPRVRLTLRSTERAIEVQIRVSWRFRLSVRAAALVLAIARLLAAAAVLAAATAIMTLSSDPHARDVLYALAGFLAAAPRSRIRP